MGHGRPPKDAIKNSREASQECRDLKKEIIVKVLNDFYDSYMPEMEKKFNNYNEYRMYADQINDFCAMQRSYIENISMQENDLGDK